MEAMQRGDMRELQNLANEAGVDQSQLNPLAPKDQDQPPPPGGGRKR
jgi:hypothetical protein